MLLYHDYNNDVKYLLLVLPSIEYLYTPYILSCLVVKQALQFALFALHNDKLKRCYTGLGRVQDER